ncbi:prostaglandin E2 receptor EP2 subtype-like [Diadema setosum]|uniref:prostaglandin E2 receptor EP2 subtype-like n=1 Tax=Diadema setosum TaxID=31175 RepID=UPI003B3A825B
MDQFQVPNFPHATPNASTTYENETWPTTTVAADQPMDTVMVNPARIQTYLTIVTGLFCNVMAVVVYTRPGCGRRLTPFTLLITTLSWVDLAAMLSYLVRKGVNAVIADATHPAYCDLFGFLTNFYPIASGCMTALLSVERYTALVKPFKYQNLFAVTKVRCMTMVMLCMSALIASLPFLRIGSYQRVLYHGVMSCKLFWQPSETATYCVHFVIYSTCGWSLLAIVIACNVRVVFELFRMKRKVAAMVPGFQMYQGREVRFVRTTLATTLLFVICWLPWMVTFTLMKLGIKTTLVGDILASHLLLANHTLDPIVFLVSKNSVRSKVLQLIGRSRDGVIGIYSLTPFTASSDPKKGASTAGRNHTTAETQTTAMNTPQPPCQSSARVHDIFITTFPQWRNVLDLRDATNNGSDMV